MLLGFLPPRTMPAGRKRPAPVKNPFNNIRPYKPIRPGEPVPEPLPPAPLLGPGELLALGALVLAQIWGLFSSRPKTSAPAEGVEGGNITGTMPPAGNANPGLLVITRQRGEYEHYTSADCSTSSSGIAGDYEVLRLSNVLSVKLVQDSGPCGPTSFGWEIQRTTGPTVRVTESVAYGYKSVGFGHVVSWTGTGAVPWEGPTKVIPLPDGWAPPEVEPEPEVEVQPERAVPPPLRPPIAPPVPPGVPVLPPSPQEPAKAPPAVEPGRPYSPRPPAPDGVDVIDGAIVPSKPTPTPTTPPDVVFPVPGGKPVGGVAQRPPATLEGIAQETGRIEKKLEALMSPAPDTLGERWALILKLVDAFFAMNAGGTYSLTEPCDPDGDGQYERRDVNYSGAFDALGVLSNKLDALAALQQAAKELRQPTCSLKPTLLGEWVSVRFQSDEISPAGDTRLSKQFRYRDQTAAHQEVHVDHWKDFVWQAGGVCVISKGLSWGTPQVWAASADEGKRVISHAAAVAGVDLTDPKHEWIVTGSTDGRYGQPGTMRVQTRSGLICVSKRSGPSGRPLLASPGSP